MQKVSLLHCLCVVFSDRYLRKNKVVDPGWFHSCIPLVTPVLQQQFGDCSKIIMSVTGMEVSSLDPCNSQFWPSQHSLAGNFAGRSTYFCLLCLFVLESWKNGVYCLSSVFVTWSPPMSHLCAPGLLSSWSSGSGCSALPSVGACLPLSLFLPSSPLSAALLETIFTGTFHQMFFCESTGTGSNPLPLSEKWFTMVKDLPLINPCLWSNLFVAMQWVLSLKTVLKFLGQVACAIFSTFL